MQLVDTTQWENKIFLQDEYTCVQWHANYAAPDVGKIIICGIVVNCSSVTSTVDGSSVGSSGSGNS